MKLLLPVLSLFLPKLKERERNWKAIFYEAEIRRGSQDRIVWFHAASMGEFEQAKQIIEKLKSENENIKILVSFFSPSGYINQKDYHYADAVVYMPPDTKRNAKMFLDKFQPDLCVFIRYEIWHNFLHNCAKRNIPAFLIAATKPSRSKLSSLELIKQFYALNYSYFTKIFTVGSGHSDFFKNLDLTSEIITATDPRFDRINASVEKNRQQQLINPGIFKDEFVLVAGSTWHEDEEILIPALERLNKSEKKYRCIFVPHEPTEEHIKTLSSKINAMLLSELLNMIKDGVDDKQIKKTLGGKHIITDSIGKLLALYALADAAYVGGAFGAGVHSVTEPAGYGLPLATGPKMKNSPDAVKLNELGSLTVIRNVAEAEKWLADISDEETNKKQSDISANYVKSNLGTTHLIVNEIKEVLKIY